MNKNDILDNRYRIQFLISKGGFGEIYFAVDEDKNIPVVIKLLDKSNFGKDARVLDMFEDEAAITSKLSHENIVKVYDLKKLNDGRYYMVMEYMDGPDLSKIIKKLKKERKKFSPEAALFIIEKIADALDYAHKFEDPETGMWLNIVHRDITPANIIITKDGQVKLVDFGVAKVRSRYGKTSDEGLLKGKIPYMSPEQVLGKEDIDYSSDLFSLGSVLYEMLTGDMLFSINKSQRELMQDVVNAKVKPYIDVLDCSDGIKVVLLRLLEKDIAKRYSSAGELRDDLRQIRAAMKFAEDEIVDFLQQEIFSLYPETSQEKISGSMDPDKTLLEEIDQKKQVLKDEQLISYEPRPWMIEEEKFVAENEQEKTIFDIVKLHAREHKKELIVGFVSILGLFIAYLTFATAFQWPFLGKSIYDYLFPPTIILESIPSGAQVYVDGEKLEGTTTPCPIRKIKKGHHLFELYFPGLETMRVPINIIENGKTEIIPFNIPIHIHSRPEGANVFINNIAHTQPTPCVIMWSAKEILNLKLEKGNLEPIQEFVLNLANFPMLTKNITNPINWRVNTTGNPIDNVVVTGIFTKKLKFYTRPSGGDVYIWPSENPVERQIVSELGVELPVDTTIKVELKKKFFESREINISVTEDINEEHTYYLLRELGVSAIRAGDNSGTDLGANVIHHDYTNRIETGLRTPATIRVGSGSQLTFQKPGYSEREIRLSDDQLSQLEQLVVSLEPRSSPVRFIVRNRNNQDERVEGVFIIDITDNRNNYIGKTNSSGEVAKELPSGTYRIKVVPTPEYAERTISVEIELLQEDPIIIDIERK